MGRWLDQVGVSACPFLMKIYSILPVHSPFPFPLSIPSFHSHILDSGRATHLSTRLDPNLFASAHLVLMAGFWDSLGEVGERPFCVHAGERLGHGYVLCR